MDNNNGVIEALAGSTVTLSSSTTNVVGGTIRSVGDGQVLVTGANVFVEDLTLEADVQSGANICLTSAHSSKYWVVDKGMLSRQQIGLNGSGLLSRTTLRLRDHESSSWKLNSIGLAMAKTDRRWINETR